MKKFVSVLLVAVLAATLCCVFASAEEKNVALNKTWSGVEPHEAIPQYDNELTDGLFDETGNFNYGQEGSAGSATPWFCFYCNENLGTNLTDRVGKVDIDLGDEGLGITKVRMQVAPAIGGADYIKVYADGEEIGTMNYEGGNIQWIELALKSPIDAEVISVEIKIDDMFFMVSEIEVYATGESAEGGDVSADTSSDADVSDAVSSEPADNSTAAVSSEAAVSSAASSTPSTSDAGVAAVAVVAVAAVVGAAVVIRKRA